MNKVYRVGYHIIIITCYCFPIREMTRVKNENSNLHIYNTGKGNNIKRDYAQLQLNSSLNKSEIWQDPSLPLLSSFHSKLLS